MEGVAGPFPAGRPLGCGPGRPGLRQPVQGYSVMVKLVSLLILEGMPVTLPDLFTASHAPGW